MNKLAKIRFIFFSTLIFFPYISFAGDVQHLKISFFDQKIGSLKIIETTTAENQTMLISGKISHTPFGIFNGNFVFKTVINENDGDTPNLYYSSSVRSNLKNRDINFLVQAENLMEVAITPRNEKTKFTNPEMIDFKFTDPTKAIITILNKPCKSSFVIYDGRRVIDVISIRSPSELECRYTYKIRSGPKHRFPFNFKKFEIHSLFKHNGNSANPEVVVRGGPFKLVFEPSP